MEALGATQTALVMREAAEGRAKNEAESTKNTSLSQVSHYSIASNGLNSVV
jgi:hypothetical protein